MDISGSCLLLIGMQIAMWKYQMKTQGNWEGGPGNRDFAEYALMSSATNKLIQALQAVKGCKVEEWGLCLVVLF